MVFLGKTLKPFGEHRMMLKIALCLAVLLIVAQVLVWVSDSKRSRLYGTHRYLDHMPPDAEPKQKLYRWGYMGWVSARSRIPLTILAVGCVLMHYIL
jgi:hypothetical protein